MSERSESAELVRDFGPEVDERLGDGPAFSVNTWHVDGHRAPARYMAWRNDRDRVAGGPDSQQMGWRGHGAIVVAARVVIKSADRSRSIGAVPAEHGSAVTTAIAMAGGENPAGTAGTTRRSAGKPHGRLLCVFPVNTQIPGTQREQTGNTASGSPLGYGFARR